MEPESRIEEIVSFASEVERLAATVLDLVKFDHTPQVVMSPKPIAVCLLARSLSNFRAGVLLLQQNQIVESRILARCCYENLFVASGLAEKPDEIIKFLEADDRASRKSRGEFLLQIADGPREDDEQFRSFLVELGRNQSKTKRTPKEIARIGPLYKAYAYYSQLSADAGHPTIESLIGRHIGSKNHRDQSIVVVDPMPSVNRDEFCETWSRLSEALLGVCVYLGHILVGPEIDDVIRPVLERYKSS
jgi:hypothetical protein